MDRDEGHEAGVGEHARIVSSGLTAPTDSRHDGGDALCPVERSDEALRSDKAGIHIDLTDVADGELLDGIMHVTGQLQEGIEPLETRMRVGFHDEANGRTRLEIRQWLPEHLVSPSEEGWLEAFTKLDATLAAWHRHAGA